MSISKEQYENIEKFSSILSKWDNELSKKSYSTIIEMIDKLAKKDYLIYRQKANFLETSLLHSLPEAEKIELNNFLVTIGADHKI